jgi:hypothetical protein
MDSNAVHDVLAEVFSAGEPISGDGPAAVFARADRIRKRQRMTGAAAAAAVAVATATVVVGTASLGVGHGSGGTGGQALGGPGSGPATPSVGSTTTPAPASAKPTRDPSARPSGGPLMDQPDFDVFATLTRLLPQGGSIGGGSTQPGFAGLNYTDPNGSTRIEVNVQLHMSAMIGPYLDCGTRNLPAGAHCNVVTQPDGTRWLAWDGPNEEGVTSTQQRFRQREVDLLYPDGRRVVASEWNAVDPKRGTATRSTPVLTLDQLTTLVTAPDWRR